MADIIKDNQSAHAPKKSHWYSGIVGNYGSYAMAGVATVLSSVENINRFFHKDFIEETRVFNLSADEKEEQYRDIVENTKHDGRLLAQKRRELHKVFHIAEKKAERELGVRNEGFSGFFLATYDKFKNIKPHQKIEVGLKMATVGALTLGAIFTINRNKKLSAQVQYHERTKDEAVQAQAIEDARAEVNAGKLSVDNKHLPANDHLGAQVQQHARAQEPALAQG